MYLTTSYTKAEWLMSLWPEFSGCCIYPIHNPKSTIGEVAAMHIYECTENKWTGEYGASRKRLCLWLADQYKNARIKKPHWTIAAFNNLILGE